MGGQGGCESNVGGDVGYGRCEPRIEGFVQCTQYLNPKYSLCL